MQEEEKDLEKYDRQIRLFGLETQLKLIDTPIVLVQTHITNKPSFVSGEILKNILLLGVNKIFCDNETLTSFYNLCPNRIENLNNSVELTVIEKSKLTTKEFSDKIIILVDTLINLIGNDKFFICSGCFSYHNTLIAHSVCERVEDPLLPIKECMIGAFFVNDLIKFIKDKKEINGFTFPEI
ncbi:E1 ubiquitin activating enzyme [Tubulinosema ratisbonensis]|uniref:E1 ubiquitin activating enzyme n=1 Tax=Tubulinosema ratisbonensis TaxID=291195 RepID=A0A437ANN8_9MICR|nr:E1 ubiquitin activating enzyme [Tubulinosema ratisbonensis]